jgi:hypothetical protein
MIVHSDQDLVPLGVIRLDWVQLRMNNLGLVSRLEPVRPVVNGTGAYLVPFHVLRISEIFCNANSSGGN